jgi:hypothetical protein
MKRTLAAFVLIMGLVPAAARGQSSLVAQIVGDKAATPKLFFSLKFGLNFSSLTGTTDTGWSGGFNFGLTATIRLSERFSLVPEITPFLRRGVSKIPLFTTGDPALDPFFADPKSSVLALTYLDFPVLVTYRLGRFHLGAGPYVALLSTAKEAFQSEPVSGQSLRFTRDVEGQYKKTDFGLAVEASWTITMPRRGMGLVFHIRYQGGLIDVVREYSGPLAVLSPGPFRNSVIQVYLSFPFVL